MTGSASRGRLARLSSRTPGQRIGRRLIETAQLFGGFEHIFIGRSALGGDFGSIEGQLQVDLGTESNPAAGRRSLQINPRLALVQQVDSFVERDLADVESQLPQAAFGLLKMETDGFGHDGRNGTALPDVKGDAAARFELYAAFLRDPLAVGRTLRARNWSPGRDDRRSVRSPGRPLRACSWPGAANGRRHRAPSPSSVGRS